MSIKYYPECPFCGRNIDRPVARKAELGEVLSGTCVCGAVYVCDPTGHNVGEAYSEALALAKGDWDIGLIGEDADYETGDMDYDLRTHQRIYAKGQGVKAGKLVFAKLIKSGAADVSQAGLSSPSDPGAAGKGSGGRGPKARIKELLDAGSLEKVADAAVKDKGVISRLISLAYDKEDVKSWRAMEALGLTALKYVEGNRIDVIRDTVRRLIWSMSDESGGIGWSSPEMLGEIIRNCPDEFSDIIPIVWSFREEGMFRPGAVWAMGRIASVRPDMVRFIKNDLDGLLGDSNPVVRGYAAWVEGLLGAGDVCEYVEKLLSEGSLINFYRDGKLLKKSVGELAAEAINSASGR